MKSRDQCVLSFLAFAIPRVRQAVSLPTVVVAAIVVSCRQVASDSEP